MLQVDVDLDLFARVGHSRQDGDRFAQFGVDHVPRVTNKYESPIAAVMQPSVLNAIISTAGLMP